MSKWDSIKRNLGDLADKTVTKTKELTGTASLKLKIANKEADREAEYKRLGKLAYAKLKNLKVSDPGSLTVRISESIARLDSLNAEIAALKAEDEARKAEKEAEKRAKYTVDEQDESVDEQNATLIMDEFNEARKTADAEYEKAKADAEAAMEQNS